MAFPPNDLDELLTDVPQEARQIFLAVISNGPNAASVEQWRGLFEHIPASDRLLRYAIAERHLNDDVAIPLLGWVWVNGEKHHHEAPAIRRLFERVLSSPKGRSLFMTDVELTVFSNLSDTDAITIYRGAQDKQSLDGWSWSLCYEIAKQFATSEGLLRRAGCKKADVIAYKFGPHDASEHEHEHEIIVDPASVLIIRDENLATSSAEASETTTE